MEVIRLLRTASPVAISNSCPTRARSTRARCSAWFPVRIARLPDTSSAIHRRRVMSQETGASTQYGVASTEFRPAAASLQLSEDVLHFADQRAQLRLIVHFRR